MGIIKNISGNLKYLILGLIFYLSSFRMASVSDLALSYSVPDYIKFIQTTSPLIIAVLMLISLAIGNRENRFKVNIKGLCYYYVFSLSIILFAFVNGSDVLEFLNRFVFLTLIFLYFWLVVSRLEHVEKIIQALFWGMFTFILSNLAVILLGIGSVSWKGRLFGLAGHPNFMGLCGTLVVITSGFFFWTRRKLWSRILYLIALSCGLWICILTGSRNSVVASLVFFVFFTFFNMKNTTLRFIFLYVSALLAFLFFNYFTIDTLDYADRGNTRAETWASMWEQASELPIIGLGKTGATSNSFLFAVVAAGVSGSIFLFLSMIQSLKVFSFKSQTKSDHYFLSFRRAFILALFSAAFFEGFLLDTISAAVFSYWLLLVINVKKKNIYVKNYYNDRNYPHSSISL